MPHYPEWVFLSSHPLLDPSPLALFSESLRSTPPSQEVDWTTQTKKDKLTTFSRASCSPPPILLEDPGGGLDMMGGRMVKGIWMGWRSCPVGKNIHLACMQPRIWSPARRRLSMVMRAITPVTPVLREVEAESSEGHPQQHKEFKSV